MKLHIVPVKIKSYVCVVEAVYRLQIINVHINFLQNWVF